MGVQLGLFGLCLVAACCVAPIAAEFHGLFEHGLFEDHVEGHEYTPQLSTFEAALQKLRSLEAQSLGAVENSLEQIREPSLPEIDNKLLPNDHPHKQMAGFEIKPPGSNAAFGSRRYGKAEPVRKAGKSETEGSRRRLRGGGGPGPTGIGGSTTTSVSVVTNGASSPAGTLPPSSAAITSDFYRFESVTLPTFVNWTMTKVSTFVHFEGSFCQSCWAIAVADAVSLMWLINGGQASLPVEPDMLRTDINYGDPGSNNGADMSAQQICDCMGVSCCTGGWPESALQYVQLNGGLSQKDNYAYMASMNVSACNTNKITLDSMITGFETVPAGNIQAFQQAVAMLPVVAFISSSSPDFGGYTGGIYDGNCSGTVDHVVLITGYGVDSVVGPYWIIKNAWGPYWGEQGYMRIVMTPGNGKCGITSANGNYPVYYPTKVNPCQGTPNPCGSGTCFLQTLPGKKNQVRCGCPPGYVENVGTWPTPSKCVPSNPCKANPNPCGAGTCAPLKDGSYSCTCPTTMVGGYAANGSPRCVGSGGQTYTVQAADTCTAIAASYSITSGLLLSQNTWLNCTTLKTGTVLTLGQTSVPAGATTYVSQATETCAKIAYGYGITVAVLQQYNPTLNCTVLPLGTNLVLPPVTGPISLSLALPAPTCAKVDAVKAGDTCASFVARQRINTIILTALNPDISCSQPLAPPTTLCIEAGSSSTSSDCSAYYSVMQGDNCPSIWNAANLTMSQFLSVNPGIRCDRPHLWVGEMVCIASPSITLAIPQGVAYTVQAGDTLASISQQWMMRCGNFATNTSIITANPLIFAPGGVPTPVTLTAGVQLLIPCPNAGSSDACGCGSSGPAMCGSDYAWYMNSCNSWCNGAGGGYPSCTACSQSCFGKVTLPAPVGTPWGCVANNGGLCLPVWDGSCQRWLSGCQNQCYQAQRYGTVLNNQYWPCLAKCRGNC